MNNLAVDIGGAFGSPFGQGRTLGDLVSLVLRSSFVLAGVIILFFFVLGGFQMIAGAGQSNPETAAKGKQAISSAVIGFIIVFVAYWIVRIIELIVGTPFITAPGTGI